MKKVFALLMVAGVFALASCGKKEQAAEGAATDSAAVVAPAVDSAAVVAPADSAAAPVDSAAHGADHAADHAAPAAH
jgi:hypothetical protein